MKRLSIVVIGLLAPMSVLAQQAEVEVEVAPEGGVIFVEHESVPPPPQQPPQQQPQQVQVQVQPAPQAYGQQPYAQPQYAAPVAQPRARRYRETYDPNREYPADAQISNRLRLGLLIPGAAMFAVPYIMTVSIWSSLRDTRAADEQPQNVLLVPAIGPFLAMANLDNLSNPKPARIALLWDGLIQTAGLAMLIVGFMPRKIVTYYADTSQPGYAVTPRLGPGGGGLDLNVRF